MQVCNGNSNTVLYNILSVQQQILKLRILILSMNLWIISCRNIRPTRLYELHSADCLLL